VLFLFKKYPPKPASNPHVGASLCPSLNSKSIITCLLFRNLGLEIKPAPWSAGPYQAPFRGQFSMWWNPFKTIK